MKRRKTKGSIETGGFGIPQEQQPIGNLVTGWAVLGVKVA